MKQKGISVLTGGAYKLFRRPHLLRLSSLLCRFSFPHLPYCIPATHILRPFVQKVRYVNRICFSEELINTACPWNRKYVPQGIGFVLCVVYAQAKLVHQVYVAFRFSQIINDVWIGFRTFTKVSCRLGKIIVPPCPVLQLRVVKPQREVYWVVGYEDGKLVARQLKGPPAGRSSAELSPDNQPHNAASSFLLYKVIYLSPASLAIFSVNYPKFGASRFTGKTRNPLLWRSSHPRASRLRSIGKAFLGNIPYQPSGYKYFYKGLPCGRGLPPP